MYLRTAMPCDGQTSWSKLGLCIGYGEIQKIAPSRLELRSDRGVSYKNGRFIRIKRQDHPAPSINRAAARIGTRPPVETSGSGSNLTAGHHVLSLRAAVGSAARQRPAH